MEAVIQRLRTSRDQAMSMERGVYLARGHAWASKTATFRQLERIAKLDVEDFAREMADDDDDDRAAIFWTVAEAIYQSTSANYFDELTTLLGEPGAYPTVTQTLGFIEGAQQLWEEVADKV